MIRRYGTEEEEEELGRWKMIGMQYNLQGKGVLDSVVAGFGCLPSEPKWKREREGNCGSNEPISVLDTQRSPSPSTSTSTLSGGGPATAREISAALAAGSGSKYPPESGFVAVPAELQPIPAAMEVAGAEDWESLLSDSGQDQFLLRWISSDVDDGPSSLKQLLQSDCNPDQIDAIVAQSSTLVSPPPPPSVSTTTTPLQNPNPQIPNLVTSSHNFPIYHAETLEEKPQLLNPFPQTLILPPILTHHQHPDPHSTLLQPPLKRPNLGNLDSRPQNPNFDKQPSVPLLQARTLIPKQVVYDQLFKASELILSGNLSNAQSILARLNHQLSPLTSPFQRASFYFKEALEWPLLSFPGSISPQLCKIPTPIDGLFKMGAYKLLSEVSPLTHFINFTSNQAILEAVGESERVHIIDFDIGSGAQWASFMAELPFESIIRCTPCLKITAFASPLTHHPFELGLVHDNLTQFANDLGISFELEVVNLDAFDPSSHLVSLLKSSDTEILAVNFPIWACSGRLSMLPPLLQWIKQLSPKIIVSMDSGCERTDLPFPHHLLQSLQYYEALLGSVDAANTNTETVSKIEKFIIQPKIENIVLGRLGCPDQMPHWKALFAAAGFVQTNISNFAETQAECVVKKTQVRGFHVGRRQGSLVLSWDRRELVCASAWRC